MTTTRFGTPIWIAASPIPGASYMVSSMSSASARISSVMRSTGAHFARRRGSGRRTSGLIDMGPRDKDSPRTGQIVHLLFGHSPRFEDGAHERDGLSLGKHGPHLGRGSARLRRSEPPPAGDRADDAPAPAPGA